MRHGDGDEFDGEVEVAVDALLPSRVLLRLALVGLHRLHVLPQALGLGAAQLRLALVAFPQVSTKGRV